MIERQKKIIAAIPLMIMVYVAVTLLLYNLILIPQVNKITGNAVCDNNSGYCGSTTYVNVTRGPESICNFALYQGENLISFHCLQGFYEPDFLLENVSGKYDSIFIFNINDLNDPWKSYNPSLSSAFVQDLSFLTESNGAWLLMNQDATYFLNGSYNQNTQAILKSGWNLIGYPRDYTRTPDLAFASLNGNYDLVLQYKKVNDTWYYYAPGDLGSTLLQIEPDYGYWIHLTADDTWVYP